MVDTAFMLLFGSIQVQIRIQQGACTQGVSGDSCDYTRPPDTREAYGFTRSVCRSAVDILQYAYLGLLDDALLHLNWSTPQHMDFNVYWFTQQIAHLYLLKAAARQEIIPLRLVDEHLQCMVTELKL